MCVSIVTSKLNACCTLFPCSCVPGYSGVNCSIAACDREDACPENEDCVMNPIFVGGYYCIPRACSALNCATNETCGRLSNADNYTCLGNPCVSDSNCNSTNGVCTYFPQSNNFSCDCNPGYAQSSRCNIALPCDQNNQEQQCRNGGTCMGGVSGDFHTCNCIGGECLCGRLLFVYMFTYDMAVCKHVRIYV